MLKRMSRPKWIGAALAALAFSSVARADDPVDVALVLAVDVSPSMSYEELKIQREGYAAAIASLMSSRRSVRGSGHEIPAFKRFHLKKNGFKAPVTLSSRRAGRNEEVQGPWRNRLLRRRARRPRPIARS